MDTTKAAAEGVPDRGVNLIVMMWFLTVVSSVTIVMRLVFRARKATTGWDDCFMLLAMLCFYGWTITLTLLCLRGGERHIQDIGKLGPDVIAEVQLLNWTSQIFGIMGVGAGKVSVSALILAIMKNSHKTWQKAYLWTFCIVLVCAVSLSCSILTFSQCRPAAALWDTRIAGTCIRPKIMAGFGTFTGAYNTFADASLALIPATIFWTLRIGFQEKVTLSIVFGLNVFTSICSGIKTSYLSQLANRTDFTWATYDIFAWVTAEFFLITVCGSLPTLKPLLDFFRRKKGSRYSSSAYVRHTGDSASKSSDIQLSGYRKKGIKNEATVSNSPQDSQKSWAGQEDSSDNIRVQKSYKVKIDRSESEQDLKINT
ncbi:integral membrane protein [Halenospora varia]|nr:integral membrane protein [Halenospora varia]